MLVVLPRMASLRLTRYEAEYMALSMMHMEHSRHLACFSASVGGSMLVRKIVSLAVFATHSRSGQVLG